MTRVVAAGRDDFHRAMERLFVSGSVVGFSDAELLERFAAGGDEAAFEALVERYGPVVLGVCRRLLRDPNDVDDAFQAVFLVLVRKAGSLRRGDLLGAWLHGVARKVALRARSLAAVREARANSTADGEALAVDARRSPSPDPADALGRDEGNAWLHEEVDRLPRRYRAPVVACYFEGRTHEEAAKLLGCPLGTVKGRLARARDLLRKRLERRGVEVSPAVLMGRLVSPTLRPEVPAHLVSSTVHYALMTAKALPITIQALAEGVLKAMVLTHVKAVAVPLTLIAAGLIAAGGTVAAYQSDDKEPEAGQKADAQPAPEQKKADHKKPDVKKPRGFPGVMGPGVGGGMDPRDVMGPGVGMRGPGMGMGRGGTGFGHMPGVPGPSGMMGFGRLPGMPGTPEMPGFVGFPDMIGWPGEAKKTDESGEPKESERTGGFGAFGTPGLPGFGQFAGRSSDAARQRLAIAGLAATVAKNDKSPETKAALEALDQPLTLQLTDKSTLDDLIKRVKEALATGAAEAVSVYVDPEGLKEAEASLDSPVSIDLENAPLKTSLRLALKQVGMAYCVRDGVVIISSPSGVLQELREAESELTPMHPDSPFSHYRQSE